jgi:hypothetical protein
MVPPEKSRAPPLRNDVLTYDRLNRVTLYERGQAVRQGASIGFSRSGRSFAQQWNLDAIGDWLEFDQDDRGNGQWPLEQIRADNAAGDIVALSPSSDTAKFPPGLAGLGLGALTGLLPAQLASLISGRGPQWATPVADVNSNLRHSRVLSMRKYG